MHAQFRERISWVQDRVHAAAERVGRPPHAVTVVAVSKGFHAGAIRAVRAVGHVDFGESRAQELGQKIAALDDAAIRWHFVGRLQRNKVKDVVGAVTLIHSVDRLELGAAVADRARRLDLVQRVLVQVNVGEDPAKGGCQPDAAAALIGGLRDLEGVACTGLMTVPPLVDDPRLLFRRLRELRDSLQPRFSEVVDLSMGMSRDFEVAVEEGATIVRVGEALFGERPTGGTNRTPRQESTTMARTRG